MSFLAKHDWAATALGPKETWSPELATTVDIVTCSGFAMFVAWGPDLTFLYNEAYAPFLGARHPWALGRPIREVWADVWSDISPLIDSALKGQPIHQTDMRLIMNRNGFAEETYWTFSYSPLRENGQVVGVLDVAVDTTKTVMARRRMEGEAERLHKSEEELLALVTAGAYSLYRMSPDWQEMRHLDGQGILEDTAQPNINWLEVYVDPADRPMVVDAINDAIERSDIFELEHRVRLADGTFGWVLSRAVPIKDEQGRIVEWFGAASDISVRREAEARREMLNYELSHRMKNILAMVQSIATQTLRNATDLVDAGKILSDRLTALARAHEILLSGKAADARLHGIVEAALATHDDQQQRIDISGPDLPAGPLPALYLTLMLHELATNATKFGALSVPGGKVTVSWASEGSPASFVLTWAESGGPPVTVPTRKGFGSRMIERGVAATFNGEVDLSYPVSGVVCTLTAALKALQAGWDTSAAQL